MKTRDAVFESCRLYRDGFAAEDVAKRSVRHAESESGVCS